MIVHTLVGPSNQPGVGMGHRNVAGQPWQNHLSPHTSGGSRLHLAGAAVVHLHMDNDLSFHLSDGQTITAKERVELWRGDAALNVNLSSVAEEYLTRLFLHAVIQDIVASSQGDLQVTFDAGESAPVRIVLTVPNWRVSFADGSLCCPLREGGVELLPP